MGNVLIEFKPDLFIKNLEVPEEDAELLKKEIFYSKEWIQMDEGSKDEEEVCEILKEKLPARLHRKMLQIVTSWDDPLIEVEGMEGLIKELKEKGFGIYLLSNASRRQKEYWKRLSLSKYFDGVLVSANVKMIKPNSNIYKHLFEKFSLNPKECFFIDDSKENILAGEKLGMKGYVFKGNVSDLK